MLGGRLIPRELVPNDTEVIHMVAWSQCRTGRRIQCRSKRLAANSGTRLPVCR
jgi:hypothetical protein